jgi:hypothetical protein
MTSPTRRPRAFTKELVLDDREVGARLVDLAQGEGVLIWHELVLPEDGCSTVKPSD